MELTDIKTKLKDRLAMGLNYGLQAIDDILSANSLLKNEIVNFRSQYNDLNRIAGQGILGYEQVEIGYNKIRMGLLELIDKIGTGDLSDRESFPGAENREVQHRKENFFELLKLHFHNLESIDATLNLSYGDDYRTEVRKGREAIRFLYQEIFKYNYQQPRYGEDAPAIREYARSFFEEKYPRLEAYVKTIAFILEYVQQEEIDRNFFQGVVRSILSSMEIALLLYYAISGIDPGFRSLLAGSGIVDPELRKILADETHYDQLMQAS